MATIALEHPDHPGRGGRVRCQLIVVDGPDMGRAVALGPAPVTVGSDRACALALGDTGVSRQHLRVRAEPDGQFLVEDLGSTNGTLYEGARLSALQVPAGATLRIGRTTLRIQPEPHELQIEPSRAHRFGELVGASLVMREVFAVLELAAASDVTVLLEGETGTGKELVASALHYRSKRRDKLFVTQNCAALPENLLESELFGHKRGAFTGAVDDHVGLFQRAHGGTVFLDEIGETSPAFQVKLLRVLQEGELRPVGSTRAVPDSRRRSKASSPSPSSSAIPRRISGPSWMVATSPSVTGTPPAAVRSGMARKSSSDFRKPRERTMYSASASSTTRRGCSAACSTSSIRRTRRRSTRSSASTTRSSSGPS